MDNFYEQYDNYMQSEQWKNLRQIRIRIDNGQCQMCGQKTDKPQVHHMRYDHFGGNEDVWRDLVTLCPECHEAVHRMMNRATGQREDGSIIRGWSDILPRFIRKGLEKVGLM